jgi:ribosome-associated translation inhibitor RaiA
MEYLDETYSLRIELNVHHYQITDPEREKMDADVVLLRRVVEDFPVSELHIEVLKNSRSHAFHVKTSLRLPKRTLFTGDSDPVAMHPAFKRCVAKLVKKVETYKQSLGNRNGHHPSPKSPGIPQAEPDWEPDLAAMAAAARDQDYTAFRRAISVYENALHKRVGRKIEQYPDAAAALGQDLIISEIVEEVFLNAFERFDHRPRPPESLGEWFESLIDPSIEALLRDPETERMNLSFIEAIKPPGL